ncbi:blastula protease 10-like [Crassostrea angulata]|uniref:blastula protease 10-like n=1 Tax=Magallana angulata TaxID=2784310 RepID=UPI0022B14B9D|nr:blastula protease 10-like [Crassostrea angulata]
MNAAILFIVVWNLCSELVAINNLQYEDGISGQITSPGYPGNYPNDVNYTWIIRTGSHSANVTFRVIDMNIEKWGPCDDYLEIMEIEPCCFRLFKRCGQLKNYNLSGRGNEIRVLILFISDKSMTDKGFNLTWKVSLPQTKALPTQKMLATTTKYKVRTTSKKMEVKTTALQLETTTPTPSQAQSTVQAKITSAPRTTQSTTKDISMFKNIFSTTFTTLIPESPSTVENPGRITSQSIR